MLDAEKAWEMEQFERCKDWIQAGLDSHPMKTHAVEHIRDGILRGDLQIWPRRNSVCITEIATYPTGLKAMHGLIAAGDLSEISDTILALEDFARLAGCQWGTLRGRKGWARTVPGYRHAHTVIAKEL